MPRYHFQVHDGRDTPDEEGMDFPDIETARTEAIRLAGGALLDQFALVGDRGAWHLIVSEPSGKPMVRVDVSVRDLTAVQ